MKGLPQQESTEEESSVPEPEIPIAIKKTIDTEHAKVPNKTPDPYKKDTSEAINMEAKYQELLKRYNIIE